MKIMYKVILPYVDKPNKCGVTYTENAAKNIVDIINNSGGITGKIGKLDDISSIPLADATHICKGARYENEQIVADIELLKNGEEYKEKLESDAVFRCALMVNINEDKIVDWVGSVIRINVINELFDCF